MKILITGSAGLLGHALVRICSERHTVIPMTRRELDTTDATAVPTVFDQVRPDIVIHAAAIPDPDACETNPEKAFLVNVEGTRNVAGAAREVGALVAFISSDAVFDGMKRSPYVESDPTNPLTVYGRTKTLGEQIVEGQRGHWIFRIPVLFGPGKTNFIEKGLERLKSGDEYIVASDQLGSALYTLDAADKMMEVMEANRYGIFHLSNGGTCTRLELARRAASLAGMDPAKIIGKPMDDMGRPAKRLKYSVMEMRALQEAGFSLPRSWKESLADYMRARLEHTSSPTSRGWMPT